MIPADRSPQPPHRSHPLQPNQPLTIIIAIRHQEISIPILRNYYRQANAIIFEDCTSGCWQEIGKALASFPNLESLSIRNCKYSNVFELLIAPFNVYEPSA